MAYIWAAHASDRLGVADHDESVGCPRQTHVKPFGCPVSAAVLIDTKDDGSTLHTLEAQYVCVEDVVGRPELFPVALLAQRGLPLGLHRMPLPKSDQRDVTGPPALVEQDIDLLVGNVQRVLSAG